MQVMCKAEGCGKPVYGRKEYCRRHYQRWKLHGDPLYSKWAHNDIEARFWSYVDKNGPIPESHPELGHCWLWTGSKNGAGYGSFYFKGRQIKAARWIYERKKGPIPEGLVLDHLCKNPSCVNPFHLEPVPQRENVIRGNGPTSNNARKTHCPKGHPYDESNTYYTPSTGWRNCLICQRERDQGRER